MKKITTLKSEEIFSGTLLKLNRDEVKCPNGNIGVREYVKHPGGVSILGFIDNKVVLEKQYRHPYGKEIFELPAGKLEPNEDPSEAAKREFEEEVGYKVEEIQSLGYIYPTPGYTNEIIYLFYASKLSKSEKHLDEDEFLQIKLVSLKEVIDMIQSNKICDAKTICLIDKYIRL